VQAQFARIRENYGLAKADEEEGGILQKRDVRFAKGTAENSPREEWIDGVRDLLAELIAESVARANADVRSAMLRSPGFLALMRGAEKDVYVQRVLIESILEAERVAGGPQELPAPLGDNYDAEAFEAAKERGRRLDTAREIVKKPIGDIVKYRFAKETAARVIEAAQAIADHLAAGRPDISSSTVAKAVADSKPGKEPMVDFGLQKSATDTTRVDVRDLGKPRRMNQSEVLR
jgi:hypothetical protein